MNEYNYAKPCLTNLPYDLGKKIFEQMDKAVPDIQKIEEESLKLKLKMVKARKREEKNKK